MQKSITIRNLLFSIALLFFLLSCGAEKTEDDKTAEEIQEIREDQKKLQENLQKAKKVFYSLPSPLETAILFRRAGASFDRQILNPLDNISNYTTNKQKALNLGIYSADLSYASLFDQTQVTIKYMAAAKKMAEKLGIINVIGKETIDKLEENVNNKAVVMDIISQAFMNSNTSLKENDRAAVATVMLVGGWIEGLYIATKLSKTVTSENELVNRIIDQRLPIKSVLSLLKDFKDKPDVAEVLHDVQALQLIFDKIKISNSRIVPVVDSASNVTMLTSTTKTSFSTEVFDELCSKVEEIRTSYIQ